MKKNTENGSHVEEIDYIRDLAPLGGQGFAVDISDFNRKSVEEACQESLNRGIAQGRREGLAAEGSLTLAEQLFVEVPRYAKLRVCTANENQVKPWLLRLLHAPDIDSVLREIDSNDTSEQLDLTGDCHIGPYMFEWPSVSALVR